MNQDVAVNHKFTGIVSEAMANDAILIGDDCDGIPPTVICPIIRTIGIDFVPFELERIDMNVEGVRDRTTSKGFIL